MRLWKRKRSPSADLKAAGHELVSQWGMGIQQGILSNSAVWQIHPSLAEMEYAVIGNKVYLRERSENLSDVTGDVTRDNTVEGL